MKKISGKIQNFNRIIIGKFSYENNLFTNNKIIFCDKKPLFTKGIIGFIVPEGKIFKTKLPIMEIKSNLPFKNGDIINMTSDGNSTVVWENNTIHNALYVTDICNSKCIMCPQVEGAISRYNEYFKILDLISWNKCHNIGITGGEPTLDMDKLVALLEKIAKKGNNVKVHILTNGRNFSKIENVEKLANIKNIELSYGIPLYSDIAEEHDYVVGVKGAFIETINGLYNLAKFKQNIEIRTVILRQNYYKLKNIAQFIYRNLPFVFHVALMGMEYHGNAETNYALVSIDPIEYKQELFEAVREYVRCNIIVDIYNTPLCLVDNRIISFCRDSISTWKKSYLVQCESCLQKNNCSGVFETSFIHSNNIKSIN